VLSHCLISLRVVLYKQDGTKEYLLAMGESHAIQTSFCATKS